MKTDISEEMKDYFDWKNPKGIELLNSIRPFEELYQLVREKLDRMT